METYSSLRDRAWGSFARDGQKAVFLGEFGGSFNRRWPRHISRYIEEKNLDFAYWSLEGDYGLLAGYAHEDFQPRLERYLFENNTLALAYLVRSLATSGVQHHRPPLISPVDRTTCSFDPQVNLIMDTHSSQVWSMPSALVFIFVTHSLPSLLCCCCALHCLRKRIQGHA